MQRKSRNYIKIKSLSKEKLRGLKKNPEMPEIEITSIQVNNKNKMFYFLNGEILLCMKSTLNYENVQ